MQRRDVLKSVSAVILGQAFLYNSFTNADETESVSLPKNVAFRGSYLNSKCVFEKTKRGRVAFLGGSITEMNGYRPMVCDYLQAKYPQTEFDFIAAGISSTCSDVGAFRLKTDVLERDNPENEPIDLFFVEFSVNDDQDGMFDLTHSIRGMEGILRHLRSVYPNADVVMTFFVNENLMQKYRDGSVATSIRAHQTVAEHYGVSTINLAKEIQEEIDAGQITWDEFGGVHPAPRGNRICANMIAGLLDVAQKESVEHCVPHKVPAPIDRFSYGSGAFRGFDSIETNVGSVTDSSLPKDGGFRLYIPDWSKIPGSFRETFANVPCLCAEKAGAEASFDFEGNALALYVLAGPDAGIIEYKIDDSEWNKATVYHPYSMGLHYPRAVMLADGLAFGKHKVVIRMSPEKPENSTGTAVRIMQICVNKE